MKPNSCECCLMPLSKDTGKRTSEKYCSYCFVDGKLLAEGMTLREFQKKSYAGMRSHGMNIAVAWLFSQLIRFAPHWKKNK